MPTPGAFTIASVSDREVLALALDRADSDGQFSTADLAAAFDLNVKHPLSNVGIRLGYLRKIGMLERDPDNHRWYLTVLGQRFARGALTVAQRRALESLKTEGATWAATESLSNLLRGAGATQATMMRRQWQHGWAQRNSR